MNRMNPKPSLESLRSFRTVRTIKPLEKSKSRYSVRLEEEDPDTLPNPNFYFGSDTFTLENGDQYSGEYCCHKTGIIWREGNGVYSTKDGHVYEGAWENDQLLFSPDTRIEYPSEDRFEGSIIEGKYNGEGMYIFSDELVLYGEFEENKPVGEIILVDYENHCWRENRGIGQEIVVKPESDEEVESVGGKMPQQDEEPPQPSLDELEKMYFKKSTKTKIDSEDKIHKRSGRVKSGKMCQDLIENELKDSQSSSEVSVSLLKMFLSRRWRKRCKPIQIIIPTSDYEESLQGSDGSEKRGSTAGLSEIEITNVDLT